MPDRKKKKLKLTLVFHIQVWVYAEDVYRFVPTIVWDKFAEVFPRVWAASAFKGAFGETMYVPNAKRHLENNLRWLEVMATESPKFKNGFAGIVLTGWQRLVSELKRIVVSSEGKTKTAGVCANELI